VNVCAKAPFHKPWQRSNRPARVPRPLRGPESHPSVVGGDRGGQAVSAGSRAARKDAAHGTSDFRHGLLVTHERFFEPIRSSANQHADRRLGTTAQSLPGIAEREALEIDQANGLAMKRAEVLEVLVKEL